MEGVLDLILLAIETGYINDKHVHDYNALSNASAITMMKKKPNCAKNTEYGPAILLMFVPFRLLSDEFDENGSWWFKQKTTIVNKKENAQIIRNMQDY